MKTVSLPPQSENDDLLSLTSRQRESYTTSRLRDGHSTYSSQNNNSQCHVFDISPNVTFDW